MITKSLALAAALSIALSHVALAQAGTNGTGADGTPPAAAETNSTQKGMAPGTAAAPTQSNTDSRSGDVGAGGPTGNGAGTSGSGMPPAAETAPAPNQSNTDSQSGDAGAGGATGNGAGTSGSAGH